MYDHSFYHQSGWDPRRCPCLLALSLSGTRLDGVWAARLGRSLVAIPRFVPGPFWTLPTVRPTRDGCICIDIQPCKYFRAFWPRDRLAILTDLAWQQVPARTGRGTGYSGHDSLCWSVLPSLCILSTIDTNLFSFSVQRLSNLVSEHLEPFMGAPSKLQLTNRGSHCLPPGPAWATLLLAAS